MRTVATFLGDDDSDSIQCKQIAPWEGAFRDLVIPAEILHARCGPKRGSPSTGPNIRN